MKTDFDRKPLRIFLSYFRPHWQPFAIDMACAVAVSAIDLIFPFVSRSAMQHLLPQRDREGIMACPFLIRRSDHHDHPVADSKRAPDDRLVSDMKALKSSEHQAQTVRSHIIPTFFSRSKRNFTAFSRYCS